MKQTSTEQNSAASKWQRMKPLVFSTPLAVYASYLVVALLVGYEHSCDGGGEFYFQLGMWSAPLLVLSPFVFGLAFKLWLRFIFSVAFLGLGIVVWVASFAVSGMYFMCRLF